MAAPAYQVALAATASSPAFNLSLAVQEYPLNLRSAFGSTTLRTNILFTFKVHTSTGYGEVGLPPKKPLCYLADYRDVKTYFEGYVKTCQALFEGPDAYAAGKTCTYAPFEWVPEPYFPVLRHQKPEGEARTENVLRVLFRALDECPLNQELYSKAARSGIEAAILDLWSQAKGQFLYQLMGVTPAHRHCYYTAGLDATEKMVSCTRDALAYTPYLKIKLDGDLPRGAQIMAALAALYKDAAVKSGYSWSVDANSAWDCATTEKFLEILQPYKHYLYMLEQPFPVDFTKQDPATLDRWRAIKAAYGREGVLIYADESFSGAADVERLKDFVHGVNVKLEKTGGLRYALKAIAAARAAGLRVWIGMMVGSTPAHLMPLTDVGGDLDGAMLTQEESNLFTGGYTPKLDGVIDLTRVSDPAARGLGVVRKP